MQHSLSSYRVCHYQNDTNGTSSFAGKTDTVALIVTTGHLLPDERPSLETRKFCSVTVSAVVSQFFML